MRTVSIHEADNQVQTVGAGNVVFEDHRDVRSYVRGIVIALAPAVASKLPMPVRWLLNADRIASILADVFDRVWPSNQTQPSTPAIS